MIKRNNKGQFVKGNTPWIKGKECRRLKLVGQKFGRLTVIEFVYVKNGYTYWLCKCECDNEKIISGVHLTSKRIKSCGCLVKNNTGKIKHGMSKTRFWNIWCGIKNRCFNKNIRYYKNYGGRGITICDNWLNFQNFKNDMYQSYKKHLKQYSRINTTIERIDNNGNYELNNCKWATYKEQMANQRTENMVWNKNR